MLKYLLPLFLAASSYGAPSFPYVIEPTNRPTHLDVVQNQGGTNGHNKWVPMSGGDSLWVTNPAAAGSISNKYTGEVLINTKLLIDQGGGDKLGFGEGLSSAYPDVSAFAGLGARYSWPSTMGQFYHNHAGYLLTLGWNNYDAGPEPIGRTYSNMSKTEDGYSFSWYNDLNGGSGSGLKDLPGNDINSNQRNPAFILASGVNNVTSEAVMRTAVSNFYAYGYGALTNYDFIRAFGVENYWLTNHRDASGVLAWNTNTWPMQTVSRTNVAYYLSTNLFELWLMLYGDTRPVQTNNTEFDVDAFTGATFWMYPNGPNGIPGGGLMQPMVTPSSKHLDITTFYQWGVGGVTFQDTTTAFAGTPGSAQQLMRGYGGSATWPGSLAYPGVSASSDWFHYYTNRTHGLILNYLWFYPPFPVSFQREANGVALESGVVINEPGSSGVLRLAIGALRSSIHSLTNWEAGTIHWIPQTDNLLYDGSWTYSDCKDLLSVMAITGGDEWIRSANGGVLTNTSFRLTVTNVGQISVWQDQLRGANSGFKVINFGPTNQICYRPMMGGDVAVFFSNEDPSVATNLTVNWGQLNFASNYPALVKSSWTNDAIIGSYTNSFTVSVPASSSTLLRFSPVSGSGLSNYVQTAISSAVGPGTINQLAMFTSVSNVGNSILDQVSTNMIEQKSHVSGTFTNLNTNRIYGRYTSANNFETLETIAGSGSTDVSKIHTIQGSSSTNGSTALYIQDSWGFEPTTPYLGHGAGDIYPLADNAYNIGSTSSRVKGVTAGPLGFAVFGQAASMSSVNMGAAYGFGVSDADIGVFSGSTTKFAAFLNTGTGVQGLDLGVRQLMGGDTDSNWGQRSSYLMFHDNNVVQIGTNNANGSVTPSTARLQGVTVSSGIDKPGGDLILAGGQSSGASTNGNLRIQTGLRSTSSSTRNSLLDRLIVRADPITLTTNSATTILTFTLPTSLTCVGAKISATTEIKDGTDVATIREEVAISAINKAGTVTATNAASTTIATLATGAATIANVWSTSVSSTTVSVKLTTTTGGIQSTTARLVGVRLELDSDGLSVVNWNEN